MYKFKSKAGADVLMLGEPGNRLLALLGKEPAPQGIFEKAQLPGYLARLEQALAEDEAAFVKSQADARAAGEPVPRREGVSLRQRAWPLIELMRQSLKEGADVIWGDN